MHVAGYDYSVWTQLSPFLSKAFFPAKESLVLQQLNFWLVYAVGFLFRPLGSLCELLQFQQHQQFQHLLWQLEHAPFLTHCTQGDTGLHSVGTHPHRCCTHGRQVPYVDIYAKCLMLASWVPELKRFIMTSIAACCLLLQFLGTCVMWWAGG
jgi:hypothetical protein